VAFGLYPAELLMFHHRFGGVLLCGLTSTVLRPGLGALGFFRAFGDGFESLCGFSGAILFGIIDLAGFKSLLLYIYCTYIYSIQQE
jgi:hypothetical protein